MVSELYKKNKNDLCYYKLKSAMDFLVEISEVYKDILEFINALHPIIYFINFREDEQISLNEKICLKNAYEKFIKTSKKNRLFKYARREMEMCLNSINYIKTIL